MSSSCTFIFRVGFLPFVLLLNLVKKKLNPGFSILGILVFTSLVYPEFVKAQREYKPMKCSGKVPSIMMLTMSERHDRDILSFNKGYYKLEKKFSVQTQYVLEDLLTNGQILYGDSISSYINFVANKLLSKYSNLRARLNFFVYRSPEYKILTSPGGVILVSSSMFSVTNRESELAYLLSREIAHYTQGHQFDTYKSKAGTKDYDYRFLSDFTYSDEQERDADSIGLRYYVEAGYDKASAVNVMENLRAALGGISVNSMDLSRYNNDFTRLYFKSSLLFDVTSEKAIKETNNRLKLSLKKRIVRLRYQAEQLNNAFQMVEDSDETNFKRAKYLAQYEFLYALISKKKAFDALNLSLILDSVYGYDLFSEHVKIQAFQILASGYLGAQFNYDEDNGLYKQVTQVDQMIHYIIAFTMSMDLSTDFALKKQKECLLNAINRYDILIDYFKVRYELNRDLSMILSAHKRGEGKTGYIRYYDRQSSLGITNKMRQKNLHCFGLDSIIMFNPFFKSYSVSRQIKENILKDEKSIRKLSSNFKRFAKKLSIKHKSVFMNDKLNLSNDVVNMNNTLKIWLNEVLSAKERSDETPFNQMYADSIREMTQSNYLMFSGFTVVKYYESFTFEDLILIISPPVFIYNLVDVANAEKNLDYVFFVIDLRSGQLVFLEQKKFEDGYKKDLVRAHVYRVLNSMTCKD